MHALKELYIGDVLKESQIHVSAPARLDIGGTWDIKGLALTHEWVVPCTTNIAISLRTHARLVPYEFGRVKLTNTLTTEEFAIEQANLDGDLRLLASIASHFGLHGYVLQLEYEAPPFAGLGGSGTVAVAFAAALYEAQRHITSEQTPVDAAMVARLAYMIEDGMHVSLCGMQDHCAAAFGGIHKWLWKYASQQVFESEEISGRQVFSGLNDRLLVAYLGKSHNSNVVNEKQLASFWNVATRKNWFAINEVSHRFYDALYTCDWAQAAALVRRENELRVELVPERLNGTANELKKVVDEYPAGFAAVGAGDGGCVWVLCEKAEDRTTIVSEFEKILGSEGILPIQVEARGIIVH